MALDNIPTLGPGGFNGNLDKVLVHKNGGSEVACSLLTLTNSALNLSGVYLDPVNQRVGIGTANPATTLQVNGVTALSNADLTGYPLYSAFNIVRNGATSMAMDRYTGAPHFNFRAAGGTIASPSTQVGELGNIGWWSHSGTAFNRNVLILAQAQDFVGGLAQTQRLSIGMGQNGGGTDYYYEMVNGNSYFGAGASGSTPASRVHIKGSGSTSGTRSLLVQNSAGTQALEILDDGTINTSTTAVFNAKFLLAVTYDISCRSIGSNAQSLNGTLTLGGGPTGNASGTAVNINFNGSPASGQIGTSLSLIPIQLQSATHIGFDVNGNYSASVGTNSLIGYRFSPTNLSTFSNVVAFESLIGGAYFNTSTRQASAVLQADSTTQGFLKPRLTTAQKNLIASPAAGLEVYDTDLNRPCFFNGTSWITL